MPTVNLCDLDQHADFTLTDVHVFEMIPKKAVLSVKSRELNGLLYLLEGRCLYTVDSRSFTMRPGSLVYLPRYSRHKYTALSKNIKYIRIDFTMNDPVTGEDLFFGQTPLLLFDCVPVMYDLKIRELARINLTATYGNNIHSRSLLLELLGLLSENEHHKLDENHECKKILPGIRFIEQHCIEEIVIADLAATCYLSPSHFRRLFKSYTGVTPVEYKNKLRIEKARQILKDGSCNINEVALQLGFESVFYFSNLFKKIEGISPSRFQRD